MLGWRLYGWWVRVEAKFGDGVGVGEFNTLEGKKLAGKKSRGFDGDHPTRGLGQEAFKLSRLESGRIRRCSKSLGPGRAGPGRVGSGRVGSGRIGSDRIGSGPIRRFMDLTGRAG